MWAGEAVLYGDRTASEGSGGVVPVDAASSCRLNNRGEEVQMATDFEDYKDRYTTIKMRREGGVLEFTFHTDNGPLRWNRGPHYEFGHAFSDIQRDPENKVIIMTGTGDEFSGPASSQGTFPTSTAEQWDATMRCRYDVDDESVES